MSSTVKQCPVGTPALRGRVSSKTFVCGVVRPQRIIRTCPSKENAKELVKFLEGIHSERSISHHKQSLACKYLGGMTSRSKPLTCSSFNFEICRGRKEQLHLPTRKDHWKRETVLEDNGVSINA